MRDRAPSRAPRPSRAWYSRARWVRLRASQLNAEPLCRLCFQDDRIVSATVCDHVEPHRDDPVKFWAGPFQSLCSACHSSRKQREEQASLTTRGIWN